MNKLKQKITDLIIICVRFMSSFAWRKEIGTCEGIATLKALEMDESGMDLKIQQDPAVAQWVAKCFASMVCESPNYTELKFDLCGEYKKKFEWMTVHIQKGNGKTPHQLRQEFERELTDLKRKINGDEKIPFKFHDGDSIEVDVYYEHGEEILTEYALHTIEMHKARKQIERIRELEEENKDLKDQIREDFL